ncbi:MAG TPA: hypothetical protein VGR73_02905 [Bryobacteraceae bacterium]|nr:hypothetical protein [Bryobacteraceae bacterium]
MIRAAAIFVVFLVVTSSGWAQAAVTQQAASKPQPQDVFRQSLQELVAYSPDPCGPPFGNENNWHTSAIESRLFDAAQGIVADVLNDSAAPQEPKDRASAALKRLEDESARINTGWPEENRFHFELLDIAPALVVKMGVRSHERFFVFGIFEGAPGKAHATWSEIGSDEEGLTYPEVARSSLSLFPLHRGPSGNVRFLAEFGHVGCAGSTGIAYDAREWDSKRFAGFVQIIKQSGAFGLEEVPGFPRIGDFKTEGLRVTLPYCWFSPIDTWDNPSMCAVDTYDLSGDKVKFISRVYNRPDLLPVAKAIEYAERRDYAALLGYCRSAQVADGMMRDLPPFVYAGAAIHVTPMGNGRESVELGDGPVYRFDVEKRNGRWLVVAFKSE